MPMEEFLKKRIGIIAITHNTPKSLQNSLSSWNSSGLLDLVDEKFLWVNSLPETGEHELGRKFGFRVVDPLLLTWTKLPPGLYALYTHT